MKAKILWLGSSLAITALLLTGCQHKNHVDQPSTGKQSAVVATVNGKAITLSDYEAYKTSRAQEMPNVILSPKALIAELVDMQLLKQAAIQAGIGKMPLIQARIEQSRDNILIQGLLQKKFGHTHYSDAELKKTYEKIVAKSSGTEYKARHILVKTKAEAEKIINQLDKGANFTALAKKDSIAPSAPQGGELGWFTADTMVPSFTAAVEKLKKGEYTKQPVHTRFGWHVILLQDTRTLNPPSFADIKPRIQTLLTQQAIQNYVSELRTKAKITTGISPIPTGTTMAKPGKINPPVIKETTGQTPTT